MVAYFDTSILVNVYIPQSTGTQNALDLVRQNAPVVMSEFGLTELKNAVRCFRFRNDINDQQLKTTLQAIDQDLQTQLYDERSLYWPAVYREAELIGDQLTIHFGIRTLDLMHLAIHTSTTDFFTADQRQFDAADSLGIAAHKV